VPEAPREAEAREVHAVRKLRQAYDILKQEIHKVIVGQDEIIDQILIAILARGHGLVVGVPGLAKTLLVSTIARSLALSFRRIQFTPDLMPSDITGTEVIDTDDAGKRSFRFIAGPIFANIVLADEINRTPPKTQAALLEAMQERQVTSGGARHELPVPFFVLATQNPIEQEGTYPLPEAQLDRFMFNLYIDYPSRSEEREIVRSTTYDQQIDISQVLTGPDILALQGLVRKVPVPDHAVDYALNLVRATRPADESAPKFIKEWLSWGAGPRAAQCLVLGAKAKAILDGRFAAESRDVRSVALPVLRHRLFTNFNADSEGVNAAQIVRRLVDEVKEPPPEAYK
jgi:MoxR-like ATPase